MFDIVRTWRLVSHQARCQIHHQATLHMLQAINQQVAIELLKKGVRTETKRHKALVNSKKAAWKARQEVSAEAPSVCCGRGHTSLRKKVVMFNI